MSPSHAYKIMRIVDQASHYLANLAATFSTLSLSVMVLIVLLGVFFRYCLNNPLVWSEELARYMMIWMAFLAVSTACRTNENIALLSGRALLPRKIQVIVKYFNRVWMLGFLAVLALYGYYGALRGMGQVSASLNVPLGIFFMIVPVSAVLVMIQILFMTIVEVSGYKQWKIARAANLEGSATVEEEWLM